MLLIIKEKIIEPLKDKLKVLMSLQIIPNHFLQCIADLYDLSSKLADQKPADCAAQYFTTRCKVKQRSLYKCIGQVLLLNRKFKPDVANVNICDTDHQCTAVACCHFMCTTAPPGNCIKQDIAVTQSTLKYEK